MLKMSEKLQNIETLLSVLSVVKTQSRLERDTQLDALMRICCTQGWSTGLRALSLEKSISYKKDNFNASLIHWACLGGDLETSLVALEMENKEFKGTTHRDLNGLTPMHWAAMANAQPTLCHALLKEGAHPDELDHWGLIPAHWSNSEAFWAWTMSALWAKGRKLAKIPPPFGLNHADVCKRLGHLKAAKWVEWELEGSHKTKRLRHNIDIKTSLLSESFQEFENKIQSSLLEIENVKKEIQNQMSIDLSLAKHLGLVFDK